MTPNRLFILIAALVALMAGMQMSRQVCPSCMLLPKAPKATPTTHFNPTTPKP